MVKVFRKVEVSVILISIFSEAIESLKREKLSKSFSLTKKLAQTSRFLPPAIYGKKNRPKNCSFFEVEFPTLKRESENFQGQIK